MPRISEPIWTSGERVLRRAEKRACWRMDAGSVASAALEAEVGSGILGRSLGLAGRGDVMRADNGPPL
jgi:hypothetical protein